MKKLVRIFVILMCIMIVFMTYTGYKIYEFSTRDIKKSDAIMVLGCRVKGETPSVSLERRMKTALDLYNEGYGKKIILTGGMGSGEDITEAEAMRRYFTKHGVSENNLIIEDKSTSTYENFKYSLPLMNKDNIKSVIVVSNGYHLRRASNIAKSFNIDATYKGFVLKDHLLVESKGIIREILATYKYAILGW